jgi:hypothetical protein
MTVDQIALFVEESLSLDWEWSRLRILGGEPTLHSDFEEIISLLAPYQKRVPSSAVGVVTNGHGKSREYKSWLLERGIDFRSTRKTKDEVPDWFGNLRMAPVDTDPTLTEVTHCSIGGVNGCGVGLTKHGFFLCGVGASIARVVGADIGVMSLRDATPKRLHAQAKYLCHLCGHWTHPDSIIKDVPRVRDTGKVASPFWHKTLTDWEQLPMSTYGAKP